MNQCKGITLRNVLCKKKSHGSSDYCILHKNQEVTSLPLKGLPEEIWVEIIKSLGLKDMAMINLTCSYFHWKVKQKFETPYYTILLDETGNNAPGNTMNDKYKYFFRSFHGMSEYIVDGKVLPYDIAESDFPSQTSSFPLLTVIRSYKEFCEKMAEIERNTYQEDLFFPSIGSLDSRVTKYATRKKTLYLFNDILVNHTAMEKTQLVTYKVALSTGTTPIDWRKCKDVIRDLANMIRHLYPNLVMFLPGGKLYYSFTGIQSF